MTATLSHGEEAARGAYVLDRLVDPDRIREMLAPDRAYSAYAIAQLEPRRFPFTEWYTAEGRPGRALVLHSRSGLGHAFFATGDPGALDAALSLHPGPRFTFGSMREEHKRVIEKYFFVTRRQEMARMSVTAATFACVDGPARRVTGGDIAAVNRLYSSEGGRTAYRAEHVDEGVYFGIVEDGNLVSIAGTHVVALDEGIAVVGNVFTHPRCRGRGLATAATSAVTAELLERCPLVVLTVETGNAPAVSAYRRLGYEAQCTLHETPLIRKEPFGAISLARRVIARWRGHGREVVDR